MTSGVLSAKLHEKARQLYLAADTDLVERAGRLRSSRDVSDTKSVSHVAQVAAAARLASNLNQLRMIYLTEGVLEMLFQPNRCRQFVSRIFAMGGMIVISSAADASYSAYTYLQSYGYHPGGHNLTTIPVATLNERVEAASIVNQIAYQGWQPDPWGKPLYSDGFARGYADLITGKVGAYAGGNAFAQSRAMAGWQDNLVFKIDGATNDTYTPITVKVRFDGELFRAATENGYQQGSASASFNMTFGQGGYVDKKFTSTSMSMQTAGDDIQIIGGGYDWDDFTYFSEGTSVIMTGIYKLRGAAPRVGINMGLDTSARGDAYANFLHTAAFDMILPDNVTYESSSGVFLSHAAVVPEPSTWLLMIVGFGTVGATMRARRKSTQARLSEC